MLQFRFVCSHSTIVSYVLFILSCTTLQLGFVCRLFGLFFWSEKNTPLPWITYGIGGSHCFLPPVAPQDPMVALPFWPPALNRRSDCTALSPSCPPDPSSLSSLTLQFNFKIIRQSLLYSPVFFIIFIPSYSSSGPPDRSSLPSLPLQAIFEPTRQALWFSPVFFVILPASSSHFRNNMPSAVIQYRIFHQICFIISIIGSTRPVKPSKPSPPSHFWTDTPSAVSQSRHSSSDS